MITIFEEFNVNEGEPEIGDYVLLNVHFNMDFISDEKYINNTIGKIVSKHEPASSSYVIEFPRYFWTFIRNQIIAFSKNKEDLEMYVNVKNFNL